MSKPRTVVRAFTKEGYHRDIAVISSSQVHRTVDGVGEICGLGPFIGPGISITPSAFPEAVMFEVYVEAEDE